MTRLARVTAHLAEHGPATPKAIAEALGEADMVALATRQASVAELMGVGR